MQSSCLSNRRLLQQKENSCPLKKCQRSERCQSPGAGAELGTAPRDRRWARGTHRPTRVSPQGPWQEPGGTKCCLPAPFLPHQFWARTEKLQPQIAAHWTGRGNGSSHHHHHHHPQHAPIQPLKTKGFVHASTLIHLGG